LKIKSLFRAGQAPERRTLDHLGPMATFIGPASRFRGTFHGRENYLVYGEIEGDAEIEGALVLGESGRWRGNIVADNVVIAGEVHGHVTARDKLELAPGARVYGDLRAPTIAIAEEAWHEGAVHLEGAGRFLRYSNRREAPLARLGPANGPPPRKEE
jgi:cytoskeletal protein CcmA (bactofilin family)